MTDTNNVQVFKDWIGKVAVLLARGASEDVAQGFIGANYDAFCDLFDDGNSPEEAIKNLLEE